MFKKRAHAEWRALPLAVSLGALACATPAVGQTADQAPAASVFAAIADALSADELVLIFPEGSVSADGTLRPFQPWLADILEKSPVPVIPLALSGLWGSVFSRHDARLIRRLRHVLKLSWIECSISGVCEGGFRWGRRRFETAAQRGRCQIVYQGSPLQRASKQGLTLTLFAVQR